MTKVPLKVAVWKEGKQYVALCLNNHVSSFGDTRKEAIKMLEEALELYFEDVPVESVQKIERPNIVPLTFIHA